MSTDPTPIPELQRVLTGGRLDADAARSLMERVMNGGATDAQIGALLGAYRHRPPTTQELAGFVRAMRSACVPVDGLPQPLVDTAGTGGAMVKSFNVSTTAAFVIAGAGLPVAKHGNRSVTSPSGSADVLEALGARIEQPGERIGPILERAGFTFLYAPSFHPAMKHAIGPRRELGVPTLFNLLGPLSNPSGPTHQLVGAGRPELVEDLAEAMAALDIEGVVVHGAPGFDEVSIVGPTTVAYVRDGRVHRTNVTPKELGVASADVKDVAGVPPEQAAPLMRRLLEGEAGPRGEMVLANAGLTLHAAGAASDPADGVELARQVVEEGRAAKTLQAYIEASNEA